MKMEDEFTEGIRDGRYVRLGAAWAIPSRWSGRLAGFLSTGGRFGVVTVSAGEVWRCYLGRLEMDGMYGQTWWTEDRDQIVNGPEEGLAVVQAHLATGQ